jgi:hypothetical protein
MYPFIFGGGVSSAYRETDAAAAISFLTAVFTIGDGAFASNVAS